MYNYKKLRGKIKEVFGTQEIFAKELGISHATLSSKLNNITNFNQDEIEKCKIILKIPNKDISKYFFNKKV